MKHRSFFPCLGLGSALLLTALGLSAAEPQPLLQFDGTAAPADVRLNWDEISKRSTDAALGFYIRFDKKSEPAKTAADANFGLFDCVLDQRGKIVFTYYAKVTDLLGPWMRFESRDTFEVGKTYHVEFSYSDRRRSIIFNVDGLVQYENDNPDVPAFCIRPFRIGKNFSGSIRDFRLYDMPLHTEYLRIAPVQPDRAAVLENSLKDALGKTQNSALKKYLGDLQADLAGLQKRQGGDKKVVTLHEWNALRDQIRNASRIAGEIGKAGGVKDGVVTAYTVRPTSQEAVTPYILPEEGVLTGKLNVIAAKGEYESASFLVVPFAPVKKFLPVIGELKNENGTVLPGSALDLTLVKRTYTSGGAWLTYHGDKRMRILTPDLLIHDDALIKVDEFRQTHSIRVNYPEGVTYLDITTRAPNLQSYPSDLPFRDADTLQPVELPEAGRNQQYVLTLRVPENQEPGLYRTTVTMLADGKKAGQLALAVRVLPFELPEARTYYDPDRLFFGFFSHKVFTGNPTEKAVEARYRNMKAHNMLYPGNWPDPVKQPELFQLHVDIRKKVGLPEHTIFAGSSADRAWLRMPKEKRTKEVYEQHIKEWKAEKDQFLAAFEKAYGHRNVFMWGVDEASHYATIVHNQVPGWQALHELGGKILTTGSYRNEKWVADIQDMHVHSYVVPRSAEIWHAAGGRIMNYAEPFPSIENPLTYRSKIGHNMYFSNYDGTMIHGYCVITRVNPFAKDYGGSYRRFAMVFPQQDGVISTLAIAGVREGFDDIRYFSMLQLLARDAMKKSTASELVREARRAMAWLAQQKKVEGDPDEVRLRTIERILNLRNLMKKYGVK